MNLYNNLYKSDFLIAIPGRLHESKGHKFLFKSLQIIKDRSGLKPTIVCIGDGPIKNNLIELSFKSNISKQIIFTDNVPQDELFRILNICNIVILPSLFEAFGIAAVEAMYLEKSLIVSNIDGFTEITSNEVDSLQVPVKSPEAIADAIFKIKENQSFALKIAKNAKVTAKRYDSEKIVADWINLFQEVKNKCVE